jgi:hypothetical protein
MEIKTTENILNFINYLRDKEYNVSLEQVNNGPAVVLYVHEEDFMRAHLAYDCIKYLDNFIANASSYASLEKLLGISNES